VTIRTILLCWLCRKAFRPFRGNLRWCRDRLALLLVPHLHSTRFFSKRLRERLSEHESHLSPGDTNLLREMIAVEIEFEGHRGAALSA